MPFLFHVDWVFESAARLSSPKLNSRSLGFVAKAIQTLYIPNIWGLTLILSYVLSLASSPWQPPFNRDGMFVDLFIYLICFLHLNVFLALYFTELLNNISFLSNTNLMEHITSTLRNVFHARDFTVYYKYSVMNTFIHWNTTTVMEQMTSTLGKKL